MVRFFFSDQGQLMKITRIIGELKRILNERTLKIIGDRIGENEDVQLVSNLLDIITDCGLI